MKVLVRFGIGLLLLLVLLLLVLPSLIDLNKYQDEYRPLLEAALNRKISLKNIRLTLLPYIGVRVADFVVQDDPTFNADPFASLAALDVRVRVLPLFIGHVEVDQIVLQEPVMTVVKDRQGRFNVSTIGKQAPTPTSDAPLPAAPAEGQLKLLALLGLDRVAVTRGQLTYRDVSTAARPTAYSLRELDAQLEHVHLGQTAHLHVTALVQPLDLPSLSTERLDRWPRHSISRRSICSSSADTAQTPVPPSQFLWRSHRRNHSSSKICRSARNSTVTRRVSINSRSNCSKDGSADKPPRRWGPIRLHFRASSLCKACSLARSWKRWGLSGSGSAARGSRSWRPKVGGSQNHP